MKYTNSHTHNLKNTDNQIPIINIFAQDIFDFNFSDDKYYSVGLHPWHSDKNIDFEEVKKIIRSHKNIVAIGETGIDKSIDISVERQKQIFINQVLLAKELSMPVIIHCVRAVQEIIEIKNKYDIKGVWIYHDFNKNFITANQLIKNNFFLSFGKSIFKKQLKIIDVIKKIDLDNVLIETDDYQVDISEIYSVFAKEKNIPEKIFVDKITRNFRNVFSVY